MGKEEQDLAKRDAADAKSKWKMESQSIVDNVKAGESAPWFADSLMRPRNIQLWLDTNSAKDGQAAGTFSNPEYDRMMQEYRKQLDNAEKAKGDSGWFGL